MNFHVTAKQIMQRLNEQHIEYMRVKLDDEWFLLVCQYGGRVFGPFKSEEAEGIFWAAEEFKSSEAFGNMISKRIWNVGGDRFWIEPELPFFIKNRDDFYGSYVVQEELDPGKYAMMTTDKGVKLSQQVDLKSFEGEGIHKNVYMAREIVSVANPFAEAAGDKVSCFAFKEELEVEDKGGDPAIYLEAWILSQVNPKGQLIVPFVGKELDALNYYEPIPEEMVRIDGKYAKYEVTGDVRYKLGFKASETTGRSGYIGEMQDGKAYLLMKNFFNDPSNVYCGAPNANDKQYGYSLFLYNDPGSQGGFAEFETCGTTISGDTGRSYAKDTVYYYFFVGDKEEIEALAAKLL